MDAINAEEIHATWKYVFITAASINFAVVLFHAIFASGEVQEWAKDSENGSHSVQNGVFGMFMSFKIQWIQE